MAPNQSQAQQLRGHIFSDQREPLPQANVYISELDRGVAADLEGHYVIDGIPAGTYSVVVSYVGFKTETRRVAVQAGVTILDVVLVQDIVEAEELEVVAEHGNEARLTASSLSTLMLAPRELEDIRGQTLGETLDALPGVHTLTTGPSISKPVVRGLHSQRLLLLNAGVPQEGQQWGGEHAPEIDPFAPVRVEVVKGAAGVEYGVGAIGGVIRVEPRELPSQPGVGGQLATNLFSNNRQGAASLLLEGHSEQLQHLAWRVQGSFRKAGDVRTPGYVVGNTAFTELNGSAALGYHLPRAGVDLYVSRFSTELGLYQGAHINNIADLLRAIERGQPGVDYEFGYEIGAPKQEIVHDLVSLKSHYRWLTGDRLEVTYGFQRNRRQEFDAHRGAGASAAFDLSLKTHSLEARLTHRPVGRFFGAVGVSGMNQANVNAASGFLIPNFRALTGGIFARETMVLEHLTVDLGTRFDYRWVRAWPWDAAGRAFVERTHTYSSLSGVLGAIYRFSTAWSIAFNAGTGWRPPGVNELYSNGVHHGTATVEIGDPGLGGERSFDLNTTLRHVSARSTLEVSAYRNAIDGFLFLLPDLEPSVTIRGVFPTFRYRQADVVLRGIDGAVEVQPVRWLGLGVSGSVLRADNHSTGEPLYGMPADRLRLHGSVTVPDAGLLEAGEVEVEASFVGRQDRVPEGADYAPPPEGYALLGVHYRTGIHWGGVHARASLSVENLLDTTYRDYLSRFRYFIDAPGRNLIFRLQIPFGRFEY